MRRATSRAAEPEDGLLPEELLGDVGSRAFTR